MTRFSPTQISLAVAAAFPACSAFADDSQVLPQVDVHAAAEQGYAQQSTSTATKLGVVYRDSIYTSTANTVILPSYTRVDGALFYSFGSDYRLQLNVENLLDKKYYASAHGDNNIMPGAPRSYKLSLNAKF
ncbi:TonB-dependent receptor domain-containing protein [Pseudoduganella sp. R-34]|uniref:TonB-dependent receptor domain-containing protein n=1 Tax=unclassified Pseudoduganella TaxID=2637179 RepID=UPI003CF6A162